MKKSILFFAFAAIGFCASAQTREDVHQRIKGENPDVIFSEGPLSDQEQQEIIAGRRKVTRSYGWSESCPNGMQGGVIGYTECTQQFIIGIAVGREDCKDFYVADNCH